MKIYQVDAFSARLFHGNPAAVVPCEAFPTDEVMQQIAAENNLAETAFFSPVSGGVAGRYRLRWFTPELEMDLCGHATLASAHVLWTELGETSGTIVFDSRSGPLPVARKGDLISLDFPARPGVPAVVTDALVRALGRPPSAVYRSRDLMCVYENKRDVHELTPDMAALARIDALGVIVTAPGAGHDFVSRFFAPGAGVPEDPVTGSAHCTLVPYWAGRLGKVDLAAHQVSRRGGELFCRYDEAGGRVHIAGKATTYLRGEIRVSDA